ncbi:hypothetical protein [Limnothrix redekei]|uniref:Uncharacterized protein n=1 Tax=Limnothrix redekei LRLZ20PSL1 TaxID=3112953 RepID=A0ABW7C649_9CYAN
MQVKSPQAGGRNALRPYGGGGAIARRWVFGSIARSTGDDRWCVPGAVG